MQPPWATNPSQHPTPPDVHTATKRAVTTDVDPPGADDMSPVQQRLLLARKGGVQSVLLIILPLGERWRKKTCQSLSQMALLTKPYYKFPVFWERIKALCFCPRLKVFFSKIVVKFPINWERIKVLLTVPLRPRFLIACFQHIVVDENLRFTPKKLSIWARFQLFFSIDRNL